MSLLICTLGSSDLAARDEALRGLSERERAARILAEWPASGADLALPIIGKALRYVQSRPGPLELVVLVASDQGADPPADAEARHDWSKDTIVTAEIVRRLLVAGADGCAPLPPERVAVWTVAGEDGAGCDPSDYDAVRRFFERRLPELRASHPEATAYLEVTGGTPAMTTGLLVAGTEVFGARAGALYIHPRRPLPATLSTGKRLHAGPLRAALRSNVATFDYDAALRLLREERAVIADRLAPGAAEVLDALLEHARCRFNFDLPGARRALEGGVDAAGDGRWRTQLMDLYQSVYQPSREALLAEVYHGAAARYKVGAYADFLTQVVRFQENALRLLCLRRGAQFIDRRGQPSDDGGRLSQAWAVAQGFVSSTSTWRDLQTNRPRLRDLALHLAGQRGEDLTPVIKALDRLNQLANLRNEAVHSLKGVTPADLAEAFVGPGAPEHRAGEIVPHLAHTYALLAGRAPGESPFAGINQLIESLLREAGRP